MQFLLVSIAVWWISKILSSLMTAMNYDRKLTREQREIKESLAAMEADATYAHAWAIIEAMRLGEPTPEELAIRELRKRSGMGQAVPLSFGTYRIGPSAILYRTSAPPSDTGTLKKSTKWLDELEARNYWDRTYRGGL